jgi:hypothetical protein
MKTAGKVPKSKLASKPAKARLISDDLTALKQMASSANARAALLNSLVASLTKK